jgi:hypothetical protein
MQNSHKQSFGAAIFSMLLLASTPAFSEAEAVSRSGATTAAEPIAAVREKSLLVLISTPPIVRSVRRYP